VWIAVTPVRPGTTTGVFRSLITPAPSIAAWPQQRTVPSPSSAQVWVEPVTICATFVRPVTVTGEVRSVNVPSPSSPHKLAPQQRTVASPITTHVCSAPDATCTTFSSCDRMLRFGFGACVVTPLPSCPSPLLPPHHTPPCSSSAHVCDEPADTALVP